MSAVLKFKDEAARRTAKKRWPDAITGRDKDELEDIRKYKRELTEYYERLALVTAHAQELGEHALALQERERARVQAVEADAELERVFRELADRWTDETEHISNINKAIAHPAYQQIIGMGKVLPSFIVPLLLQELERTRDHWLAALHEITKEDPAQEDSNFEEAVQAWMNWGIGRGYLTEAGA